MSATELFVNAATAGGAVAIRLTPAGALEAVFNKPPGARPAADAADAAATTARSPLPPPLPPPPTAGGVQANRLPTAGLAFLRKQTRSSILLGGSGAVTKYHEALDAGAEPDGTISLAGFRTALTSACRARPSGHDVRALFDVRCTGNASTAATAALYADIFPRRLSLHAKAIVEQAWHEARSGGGPSKRDSGTVLLEHLLRKFNAAAHPDSLCGLRAIHEVESEIEAALAGGSGGGGGERSVTFEQFLSVHADMYQIARTDAEFEGAFFWRPPCKVA